MYDEERLANIVQSRKKLRELFVLIEETNEDFLLRLLLEARGQRDGCNSLLNQYDEHLNEVFNVLSGVTELIEGESVESAVKRAIDKLIKERDEALDQRNRD